MDKPQTHVDYMQRLVEVILTSPGDTEPSVRQAIEGLSAQLSVGLSRQTHALPSELINYVKKVALHAYKTTDEDIEVLRKAGYTEDAIFEITLSAAIGAGKARLECGLGALKEESE